METIYRRKPLRLLTDEQKAEKAVRDRDYEVAVQNLSEHYYKLGTITEADYKAQKKQLYANYEAWAQSAGLIEEVTPQEQLTNAETTLTKILVKVNEIRQALGQSELELTEKTIVSK